MPNMQTFAFVGLPFMIFLSGYITRGILAAFPNQSKWAKALVFCLMFTISSTLLWVVVYHL